MKISKTLMVALAFLTTLMTKHVYAQDNIDSYVCHNGTTKKPIAGDFYRDEALLLQLAGGICHKVNRPYRPAVYECSNPVSKKPISGEFDQDEIRLIQLAGGICKVKPQYLNNGFDGDVSELKKLSISDKAIKKAIREARSKFNLHDHEFLRAEVTDEGFKSIEFSLVFRNWEYKTTRIHVKMRYWTEKIKTMHKE